MSRDLAVLVGGLAGCALVAASCSQPSPRASFASVDPQERTAAVLAAAESGDEGAIPDLIAALDSADPAQRMLASLTLKRMTGKDFGYHYAAGELERRRAVDRWADWWEREGAFSDPNESPSRGADRADEELEATVESVSRGEQSR